MKASSEQVPASFDAGGATPSVGRAVLGCCTLEAPAAGACHIDGTEVPELSAGRCRLWDAVVAAATTVVVHTGCGGVTGVAGARGHQTVHGWHSFRTLAAAVASTAVVVHTDLVLAAGALVHGAGRREAVDQWLVLGADILGHRGRCQAG